MSLKSCMFTNTPDHHFIIDVHPQYPQVSFTSPCSGHGYKFASVLGEIMADLAERGETRHNIDFFRLERFAGHPRARRSIRPAQPRPLNGASRPAHNGLFERQSLNAAEAVDAIRPFW